MQWNSLIPHNGEKYFSGEILGEFWVIFREFWKIFSRSTVLAAYAPGIKFMTVSNEQKANYVLSFGFYLITIEDKLQFVGQFCYPNKSNCLCRLWQICTLRMFPQFALAHCQLLIATSVTKPFHKWSTLTGCYKGRYGLYSLVHSTLYCTFSY